MLGGLAADEGAPGLDAALGNAGDQLDHLFRYVFSNGDVIQEKEGLGPAADDVVDAHGNAVDAYGIVLAHELGDTLLGAHAVGARDQHRLFHAGEVGGKQPTEAPQPGDHAGDEGAPDMLLHQLYALIARLDVDPGGGIGRGMRFFHGSSLFFTCPTVGADLVLVDADGLQQTV